MLASRVIVFLLIVGVGILTSCSRHKEEDKSVFEMGIVPEYDRIFAQKFEKIDKALGNNWKIAGEREYFMQGYNLTISGNKAIEGKYYVLFALESPKVAIFGGNDDNTTYPRELTAPNNNGMFPAKPYPFKHQGFSSGWGLNAVSDKMSIDENRDFKIDRSEEVTFPVVVKSRVGLIRLRRFDKTIGFPQGYQGNYNRITCNTEIELLNFSDSYSCAGYAINNKIRYSVSLPKNKIYLYADILEVVNKDINKIDNSIKP